MKLTIGVNFINILHTNFCTKVYGAAFIYLPFGFEIYWRMNIGAKAACKMLVKLTTGGILLQIVFNHNEPLCNQSDYSLPLMQFGMAITYKWCAKEKKVENHCGTLCT